MKETKSNSDGFEARDFKRRSQRNRKIRLSGTYSSQTEIPIIRLPEDRSDPPENILKGPFPSGNAGFYGMIPPTGTGGT